MCLGAAQTSVQGSSPERRIGLRRSRTDRNSGATTSTVIKRSDCQTIAKCYNSGSRGTEVPPARRRSTKMGEIIGLGCTHYPGVTVPDERLPETLGRHPVVRDYAE